MEGEMRVFLSLLCLVDAGETPTVSGFWVPSVRYLGALPPPCFDWNCSTGGPWLSSSFSDSLNFSSLYHRLSFLLFTACLGVPSPHLKSSIRTPQVSSARQRRELGGSARSWAQCCTGVTPLNVHTCFSREMLPFSPCKWCNNWDSELQGMETSYTYLLSKFSLRPVDALSSLIAYGEGCR